MARIAKNATQNISGDTIGIKRANQLALSVLVIKADIKCVLFHLALLYLFISYISREKLSHYLSRENLANKSLDLFCSTASLSHIAQCVGVDSYTPLLAIVRV